MLGDLYLFNLITGNLILASKHFSQQTSSLNCVQLLASYKVHNPPGQVKMEDTFYMQLSLFILYVYTNCMHSSYDVQFL